MAYEICSSVHTLYSAILQLRRTHTHTHTIGALGGIGDGGEGGEAKDYDVLTSHRSTRKHRNHRMYHINACVCAERGFKGLLSMSCWLFPAAAHG